MEKYVVDERSGWEYELKGEHYYPTGRVMKNGVITPQKLPTENEPEEEKHVGIWGQRHLRYIRQYKKSLYFNLFVSGNLSAYLSEIDAQAEDFFLRTVKEMAVREGITEQIKAENQLLWIARIQFNFPSADFAA